MSATATVPPAAGGQPAPGPAPGRRNVLILALCQALAMSGQSVLITIAALAGQMLAVDKSLATLPVAVQFTATMLSTIPASLLMGRIGRRAGFTIGQTLGVIGALIAIFAIYQGSLTLLAVGAAFLGVHNAFWQYYRFAAAEVTSEAMRARAISYVLTGGLVAAFIGPQLARATRDALTPFTFAGSYAAIIVLSFLTIMLLQFIRIPLPHRPKGGDSGRPLPEIMRQPAFVVAVLSAMFGYAVMTLVMVATPLAMLACGLPFADTALVIQWHLVGMFAPGFVTGHLIRRFGVLTIIIVGTVLNVICMAVNLAGVELTNFWLALLILGVGWNFMFIGGTTLLTEVARPEERAKVQAANDFMVFTMVAAASFSSGALQHMVGWQAVNAAVALPMLIAFAGATWLMRVRRRAAAGA